MSPETFWGCSVKEFVSAMEGHMLQHKGKQRNNPVTRNEMHELMRRFPD